MKINDFLKVEMLGNKFFAVRGYEEVIDKKTKQHTAYRLNVSIQDTESEFFMDLISVKVKSLNPTLTVESLKNSKTTPVIIKNLSVTAFNGELYFNCDDILPVNTPNTTK